MYSYNPLIPCLMHPYDVLIQSTDTMHPYAALIPCTYILSVALFPFYLHSFCFTRVCAQKHTCTHAGEGLGRPRRRRPRQVRARARAGQTDGARERERAGERIRARQYYARGNTSREGIRTKDLGDDIETISCLQVAIPISLLLQYRS